MAGVAAIGIVQLGKGGKKEEKPKKAAVIREAFSGDALKGEKEKATEEAQKKLAEALGELTKLVRNQKGLADKIEQRTKELGALEGGIPRMEKSLAALQGELEQKKKAQLQRSTHLKNLEQDLEAKKSETGKLFDLAKKAGLDDMELVNLVRLGASLKDRQKRGEQGLEVKIERVMQLNAKLKDLEDSEVKVKMVREEAKSDEEAKRNAAEAAGELRKEIAEARERIEGKAGEKGLKAKLEENKERFMSLTAEISEKIKEIEELKKEAGLAEPEEKPRQ